MELKSESCPQLVLFFQPENVSELDENAAVRPAAINKTLLTIRATNSLLLSHLKRQRTTLKLRKRVTEAAAGLHRAVLPHHHHHQLLSQSHVGPQDGLAAFLHAGDVRSRRRPRHRVNGRAADRHKLILTRTSGTAALWTFKRNENQP